MIKCGDDCQTICRHCVYLYKDHNPDLAKNDAGLCTMYRDVRKYTQSCDKFHCLSILTNDPNDERFKPRKTEKTRGKRTPKIFLKTVLRTLVGGRKS